MRARINVDEIISADNLVKSFGKLVAVDHLSFRVRQGRTVGLVGPNGAGKTTTMKMLLRLIRPDEGVITLFGKRSEENDINLFRQVGFLPDVPAFPEWMRPPEYLTYIGGFFSKDHKMLKNKARELMEFFGLSRLAGRKIEGFSRGERQRLGMAQAMMGNPLLIILDEPTSGLDPLGRHDLLSYIELLKGSVTVLISTHLLEDVERVCDDVIMIDQGRLLLSSSLEELKRSKGENLLALKVEGDTRPFIEALQMRNWIKGVTEREGEIILHVEDPSPARKEIPILLAEKGLALHRFENRTPTLEEIYVALARRGKE
jgi:ABC-2 type transport system ATP-binding protein